MGVVTAAVLAPAAVTVALPAGLVVLAVGAVAGVVVVGDNVRTRREAQAATAAEAARRAALTERARIAREMHDIIAHRLSLIVLQAEAAPHQIPDLPPTARARFELLRAQGADGLGEMRRLLGVLREESTNAPREPTPGLEDLPALIATVRANGMVVSEALAPVVSATSAVTGVAAYRVVQEALSNAARHAPGAPVSVEITVGEDAVHVCVRNTAAPRIPAGPSTGSSSAATTSGYGLLGMRERVTAAGGTLHAGPGPDGGFAVIARLPTLHDASLVAGETGDGTGDGGAR